MSAPQGFDFDLVIPCITIEVGEAGERGPAGVVDDATLAALIADPTTATHAAVLALLSASIAPLLL